MQLNKYCEKLIHLILPKELFSCFELTGLEVKEHSIHAHLEECCIEPEELKQANEKLVSTGFYEPVEIPDFPIRDKPFYLHIKRRKWEVVGTGEIRGRDM